MRSKIFNLYIILNLNTTKLKVNTTIKFKAILTNGTGKLHVYLGLERKYEHETYTLLRLCLIAFLSAHILHRVNGLVDYLERGCQGL